MIEVRNLSKSFGGMIVLQDVSLQIEEGETFAVIGQSGSGKSVLLKHIIGLLKPDTGVVKVDGVDINDLPYAELRRLRRSFGVLFQGGALFDSMNAFENIAFPLRMHTKMSEPEITTRVTECLAMVDMHDAGPKLPSELSGGMKKRVGLARAIALRPKYIFYDEPNSGLDPQTSNTIDVMIRDLASRLGITSIVISHDMHSVLKIADRIAYIYGGRIHWTGTVDELHDATDEVLLDFVKANEYQIGSAQASPVSSL
jgi:phospholipid/cholesterol/gamma-HCH transport system ATP-binding protein